jgi:hypothetical protein
VKSKFVGKMDANLAFLQDPRLGHEGSRALGWTSNTGNYFGADGSQGTVLNVNTTAGHKYKLTLCKSLCVVSQVHEIATFAAKLPVLDVLVDRHVEWSTSECLVFDHHSSPMPNERYGQLALQCDQAGHPGHGPRNAQSNCSGTVAPARFQWSLLDTDV